jgi:succinate-acetate transporter protein
MVSHAKLGEIFVSHHDSTSNNKNANGKAIANTLIFFGIFTAKLKISAKKKKIKLMPNR